MSVKYRADIDGLRTLAVVPVILFHFGLGSFHGHSFAMGGFVGVDVFFVISGFLISRVIYDQIDAGRYNVVDFYIRRARRIFPALFAVYAFCAIMVMLTGVGSEAASVRNSLLASLFFVSNIYFSSQAGYFGGALDNNPLLHTWSLSVEEQFYVLFPLLLLALRRLPHRRRLAVVSAVMVFSLCFSEYLVRTDLDVAYYSIFTRAWELLVGSLLAVGRLPALPRPLAEASGFAGVAMLAAAIAIYDKTTPFPGVAALLPCLGTALIIHSGASAQTLVARMLAVKPLRFTGLISYSLYLWHWPLLVFYHLNFPTHLGGLIALLGICYGVSALSWRYIEQPVRHFSFGGGRSAIFKVSAFAIAGVAALGIGAVPGNALVHPPTAETIRLEAFVAAYKPGDIMREGTCFLTSNHNDIAYYNTNVCLASHSDRHTVLLIGDSHSAQYWMAFQKSLPDAQILQASSSGCLPLLKTTGERRCRDLWAFITQEYLPRHHVDTIVLSALWTPEAVDRALTTAEALRAYASHVVIIGPNPTYDMPFPRLMMLAEEFGEGVKARHILSAPQEADTRFRAAKLAGGVEYLSYYAAMCTPACPSFASNGDPTAFDGNHLTEAAAADVVKRWAGAGMLH